MPLVVFLRGVNVGGHRTFRPSLLAKQLRAYDVINIGAAGTFVVRKPGPRAKFRAQLLRNLPFETEVLICDARDLLRLATQDPFAAEPPTPDVIRFVSILSKPARLRPVIPITLPPQGEWFLRVIAANNRFICGLHRRHMTAIAHLGRIDKLFGVPLTTRNWNTITTIVKILKSDQKQTRRGRAPRALPAAPPRIRNAPNAPPHKRTARAQSARPD
jgi:uncharacterized protein (DUF1697 family)